MKKVKILKISSAFALLSFISCKKDHTCSCSYVENGLTVKQTITYHKVSNKTAKTDCTNQQITFIDSNGAVATISLICVLN